jgi:hypothetical protein
MYSVWTRNQSKHIWKYHIFPKTNTIVKEMITLSFLITVLYLVWGPFSWTRNQTACKNNVKSKVALRNCLLKCKSKKFPGNEVIATRPHYFNSNDDALDYDLLSAPDNFWNPWHTFCNCYRQTECNCNCLHLLKSLGLSWLYLVTNPCVHHVQSNLSTGYHLTRRSWPRTSSTSTTNLEEDIMRMVDDTHTGIGMQSS